MPTRVATPVTDDELLQAIGFVGTSNGNAYQRHMHHLTLLALQELKLRRASEQRVAGPTERERAEMCGPDPVRNEELGL